MRGLSFVASNSLLGKNDVLEICAPVSISWDDRALRLVLLVPASLISPPNLHASALIKPVPDDDANVASTF
jgi:hypothetical protein